MEREGLGDMVLHQAYQEGGMGMVASPSQPHPLPHDHVFVIIILLPQYIIIKTLIT